MKITQLDCPNQSNLIPLVLAIPYLQSMESNKETIGHLLEVGADSRVQLATNKTGPCHAKQYHSFELNGHLTRSLGSKDLHASTISQIIWSLSECGRQSDLHQRKESF